MHQQFSVTKQPECVSQTKHKTTRHPSTAAAAEAGLKKELPLLYDCLLLALAAAVWTLRQTL